VLNNTIGWKDLDKSYTALLGLGIITVVDILKWDSQWPRSIYTLVILINLTMQLLFLMILLMCLQDNLFRPGVEELLHFSMVLISFSFEKGAHVLTFLPGISLSRSKSTWQFCVELKELWRASYKLSNSMQGWLLYWIALVAGSFCFLTQFMSSQGLYFLLVISSIFPSKKLYFVFLTIPLNFFQSSRHLDCLYALRSLW